MVIQQGLIVVAFVQRVSSDINRFGEVAESEVECIDFIVPWLVIEHDVHALVLLLVFYLFLIRVLLADTQLLVKPLLFLLVRADYHLYFIVEVNYWLCDLRRDFTEAVGCDHHHDGGEDDEGQNEIHLDVVAHLVLHFVDFCLDY